MTVNRKVLIAIGIVALVMVTALLAVRWWSHRKLMEKVAEIFDNLRLRENLEIEVVAIPAECFYGDLDYIRFSGQLSGNAPLLMTIEDIRGGEVIWKTKFSMGDSEKTKTFKEPLKLRSSPVPALLTICQDREGKGKCAGKEVVPQTVFLREYFLKTPRATKLAETDKIFFNAFAILDDGRIYLQKTSSAKLPSEEVQKVVRSYLKHSMFKGKRQLDSMLESTFESLDRVGSYPVVISVDHPQVLLPRSHVSCDGEMLKRSVLLAPESD